MDTSTVMNKVTSTLEKSIKRLQETLKLLAAVEDLLEEVRLLYCHIFHIKCHSVMFEVYYLLSNLIPMPVTDSFDFLASFILQMSTFKTHLTEMKAQLKSTSFDFENLNEIFSLIGKGAKHENLFVLAEKEMNRFYYSYVEKQVYWHMRYYWETLTDWIDDLQTEIAHSGAYLGIDASDGLHPVKIQEMIMKALSDLSMMRTNYFGLKDMLTEIINDKGTGAGKFLQGFRDDNEKTLVLYAIALSIPENYSKELCGILEFYKEMKMYKQVRN